MHADDMDLRQPGAEKDETVNGSVAKVTGYGHTESRKEREQTRARTYGGVRATLTNATAVDYIDYIV